ncbi:MAG: toxin, family [Verrucomicrobiales bacterium]|nr:toxin, family [Verrucomicrobiales bacterium]
MRYILDSNVISEMVANVPRPEVVAWIRWHESESGTSSVLLAELEYGIQLMPTGKRRQRLEEWLEGILGYVQIIPFDVAEAREWSRLMAHLTQAGRRLPVKDSMIAATALVHGLTVVTRNVRDFERTGVTLVNPFLES